MASICAFVLKDKGASASASELEAMLAPARFPGEGSAAVKTWKNIGVAAYDRFGAGAEGCLFEDDELLVACDAEIYNAVDLGGKAGAEAALVATLFKRKGKDWWRDAQGVYAVFIWQKHAERGLAFSDRI